MTFGKKSEEHERFYEILTNKEEAEWLRARKKRDEEICEELMAKEKAMRERHSTWVEGVRSTYIHHKAIPPQDLPRVPTKLRQRALPKISSFWNTDVCLEF